MGEVVGAVHRIDDPGRPLAVQHVEQRRLRRDALLADHRRVEDRGQPGDQRRLGRKIDRGHDRARRLHADVRRRKPAEAGQDDFARHPLDQGGDGMRIDDGGRQLHGHDIGINRDEGKAVPGFACQAPPPLLSSAASERWSSG